MKLTQSQEEALLQHYDKIIWSIVHRFRRKNGSYIDDKDDLHSECMVVFINHIHNSATMSDLRKIPVRDMINAMCVYVLGEQAVTLPKRTANFSTVIRSMKGRADYDELDKWANSSSSNIDEAIDKLAFQQFCESLPRADRMVVHMKMKGYKNREIAQLLGMNDVKITRTIKRIKKAYDLQAA